jgi:hypothetical protein
LRQGKRAFTYFKEMNKCSGKMQTYGDPSLKNQPAGICQKPTVDIPQGFNGKIIFLNPNDVLCGRGSAISNYSGNIKLRSYAAQKRAKYHKCSIKMKSYICAELVKDIRTLNPPGRFLEMDEKFRGWIEIGDVRARKKVWQAIRD